jgi:outer membrane protein TolC
MTAIPSRVRLPLAVLAMLAAGCQPTQPFFLHEDGDLSHYLDTSMEISYPDVNQPPLPQAALSREPLTVLNPNFENYWHMTLQEAVATALQNSKTVRTLGQVQLGYQVGSSAGGPPQALSLSPEFNATIYDPAIQESSETGPAQALSRFDAQLSTQLFWERGERPQNVEPTQIGQQIFARLLESDTGTLQTELAKRSASGTQYFLRNQTLYEWTSRPLRNVPSDWLTLTEAEARQPLLRNFGTQVNRVPILVARIQSDVALAQLELAVRDLVLQVERGYWDLYFFYRNLSAAEIGRDSALQTWQRINALLEAGASDTGEAAQAKTQYYQFRARVEQAQSDLLQAEANLRFLLGIEASDGRLIKPIDEPITAPLSFDWEAIRGEALARNVEIRQMKWLVKQRELELIAARNLVLPQLDLVATYRWLGLGDQLITGGGSDRDFPLEDSGAVENLLEGDFQEWRLGFEMLVPIGFRAEFAQMRNAQLRLAREQARLRDLELEITHQLDSAFKSLASQLQLADTNLNAYAAARDQVESYQATYVGGLVTLDVLLEAQQRQADAEVAFFQAVARYNQAIADLHRTKGSLLEYDNIIMQEGPWPTKAYYDALLEARRRDASYYWNYGWTRPGVVSRGAVIQHARQVPLDDAFGQYLEQVDDRAAEELPAPAPAPQADPPQPAPADEGITGSGVPRDVQPPRTANNFDWGSLELDAPLTR